MLKKVLIVLGGLLLTCTVAQADINDGLVAYYPFDGNANDESGNGNNGIVYGATLMTDRFGNQDSAYWFDGTGDFIEVPHNEILNFAGNDFSYSLWLNIDSGIDIQGGEVVPLSKFNKYIGGYGICVRGYAEDYGRPYAIIGYNKQIWATQQDLRDDEWHLLTFVKNGDYGLIYIDSQLSSVGTGVSTQPASVEGSLFIGERSFAGGNGEYKGSIDDIRIYNRALSESEIQMLYSEASQDTDEDGIVDTEDNCPDTYNPEQADIDQDGFGDVCDDDNDHDEIIDEYDNCPTVYNPDQADVNTDGYGDACVSTDTIINPSVTIGENIVIGSDSEIKQDVTIGDNALIGSSVTLEKEVIAGDSLVVGDNSTINKETTLGNDVSIGSDVVIAKSVIIGDGSSIGDGTQIEKDTIIGNITTIGMNCLIEKEVQVGNNVTIGDNVIITKGSIVPDDAIVPDNTD